MTDNKRFEAYFDNHMDDWKVQDNLTLDIYPCVSQKVAEAFTELLNGFICSDLKLLKSNVFLLKENEQLKQENKELKEEQQVFFEIVDSFIRGVESEKGIAPENEKFQYAMDQTLNWMTRLREDLKNPNQYLKLRKQLEKENKMFILDKEKENNMF